MITKGVLNQLFKMISVDPSKEGIYFSLILKTLSVIQHFDGTLFCSGKIVRRILDSNLPVFL